MSAVQDFMTFGGASDGGSDIGVSVLDNIRRAQRYNTDPAYLHSLRAPKSNFGRFDGVDDGLEFADHSDFTVGLGDFTIEMEYTPDAFATSQLLFVWGDYAVGTNLSGYSYLHIDGMVYTRFYKTSAVFTTEFATSSGFAGQIGTKKHIAWVKNGTIITVYVGGVAVATVSVASDFSIQDSNLGFMFGKLDRSDYVNNWPCRGKMENIRVSVGIARYTSNFTPPTTYPVDSYVKLYVPAQDDFKDVATNKQAVPYGGLQPQRQIEGCGVIPINPALCLEYGKIKYIKKDYPNSVAKVHLLGEEVYDEYEAFGAFQAVTSSLLDTDQTVNGCLSSDDAKFTRFAAAGNVTQVNEFVRVDFRQDRRLSKIEYALGDPTKLGSESTAGFPAGNYPGVMLEASSNGSAWYTLGALGDNYNYYDSPLNNYWRGYDLRELPLNPLSYLNDPFSAKNLARNVPVRFYRVRCNPTGTTVNGGNAAVKMVFRKIFFFDEEGCNINKLFGVKSATANTVTMPGGSPNTDEYKGMMAVFNYGVSKGQVREVIAYDGVTKTFTFDSDFTAIPMPQDTFRLFKVIRKDVPAEYDISNIEPIKDAKPAELNLLVALRSEVITNDSAYVTHPVVSLFGKARFNRLGTQRVACALAHGKEIVRAFMYPTKDGDTALWSNVARGFDIDGKAVPSLAVTGVITSRRYAQSIGAYGYVHTYPVYSFPFCSDRTQHGSACVPLIDLEWEHGGVLDAVKFHVDTATSAGALWLFVDGEAYLQGDGDNVWRKVNEINLLHGNDARGYYLANSTTPYADAQASGNMTHQSDKPIPFKRRVQVIALPSSTANNQCRCGILYRLNEM